LLIADCRLVVKRFETLIEEFSDFVVDDPLLGLSAARLLNSLKVSSFLSAEKVLEYGRSFAQKDRKNGQQIEALLSLSS